MSYDPDDGAVFTRGRTQAELEADTRAFWGKLVRLPWLQIIGWAVVAWLIWSFFGRWLLPLVALGAVGTLAYTYRDSALGLWLRSRVWDAFWAWILPDRTPYQHAYDRRAQEAQERDTAGELARMREAEQSTSVEASLFLSQSRPAIEDRLATLLTIPKPTPAQHRERSQLEQWIREDRRRAGELLDAPTVAMLSEGPRRGGAIALVNAFAQRWALWIIGPLLLLLGAQTVRVASLKQDVRERDGALVAATQSILAMERRIDRDAARLQALADARAADGARVAETERANARRLEEERRRRRALETSVRRLEDARTELDGSIVDFRDQLRELAPDPAGEPPAGTAGDAGAADPGL